MTPPQTTTHGLLAPNKRLEAQQVKTLLPQATRGAAGQDAPASSDRRVQPAVTTADYESPGTTRPERDSLPRHNDSSTLASVPVASELGPSLQTLSPDERRASVTRSRGALAPRGRCESGHRARWCTPAADERGERRRRREDRRCGAQSCHRGLSVGRRRAVLGGC